jgi:NTE family protein/lysophospholipid hydrolase
MPADPAISALLRTSPAFAQLSPELANQVVGLTSERMLNSGEYLAHEGDSGDELFLVVSGNLILSRHSSSSVETQAPPIILGSAGPGTVVGELSLLTGHPRAATLQADQPTIVRVLSSSSFDRLCTQHPAAMAPTVAWMADRLDAWQIAATIDESSLLRKLPAEVRRELAAAFTRIDLKAAQAVFQKGDPGDALYLILSGRIHLLHRDGTANPDTGAAFDVLAELGKGDVFGELSLLTGETRSATALAMRDSHLARLDKAAFDRVVAAYPVEVLGLFSRQFAGRLSQRNLAIGRGRISEGRPPLAIAVLPLTPNEQTGGARDFTLELVRQLSAFGPTLHLNRAVISRVFRENRWESLSLPLSAPSTSRLGLDTSKLSEIAERRLLAWLDDLESLYRHIVYEADYQTGFVESSWTARCLRQADALLVVAGSPADPLNSEKTMVRLSQKALPSVQTTLVLIHPEGPGNISHTRVWKTSLGIEAHHHIRRTDNKINPGDTARLARALNRKSVGLALGGGFALGLAHIGIVDAMRDLDIPIDFVGGTSMGAIIAAACAQEFTHDQMLEVMDQGCAQALKGDYTLPIVSLLTGRKVGLALGKYLEHLDIEDLWLPYFAISASLVQARMVVHQKGSALRSVLASCRAPGMFPPLGWDGDVLVDGGLVNNIPADVMRTCVGSGLVFAADVSPESEFLGAEPNNPQFGMALSGWSVARHNANPFRRGARKTTIADILMRLIRLGGVAHNQQIKASADLYLTIPLAQFSVKDFHRGEEMSRAGYDHALRQLQSWIAEHGRPWLGASS